MLVLITYDVSTKDEAGAKRLNKVAKQCSKYGQRVQNSVFECLLQPEQLVILREKLLTLINLEQDSLRIYNLGKKYQTKTEHYGAKETYAPEGVLML